MNIRYRYETYIKMILVTRRSFSCILFLLYTMGEAVTNRDFRVHAGEMKRAQQQLAWPSGNWRE